MQGITPAIMEKALEQARTGRLHILGEMNKALSETSDFSVHAPRIETMTIPTDKIREVIGTGGKVIREIVEVSGAQGPTSTTTVVIKDRLGERRRDQEGVRHDPFDRGRTPRKAKIYKGTVVKIVDFGAFVNFFGKRDGLVHVSQIENRR